MPLSSSTKLRSSIPIANKTATTRSPSLKLSVKLTIVENNKGPTNAVAFPENA